MKIKVQQLESKDELGFETDGKLEMVRVNNQLINLGGRSLPF